MERLQLGQRPRRYKTPSFSSSLLDAIYHSIDEQREAALPDRRNGPALVEEEIESLRRAIMVEKWMEHYTPRHLSSNSGSSTDSSAFSSSETDSSAASRSSAAKHGKAKPAAAEAAPKREGRFTRTKSRAMKIYGDLKKVKEPNSPGGKIASFLNSIFSPRNNLKKNQAGLEEFHPVRKSRSMKDTTGTSTTTTSTSASCLSKNHSSSGASKSKRSVRFCPVSVILDQDSRPCGHKNIYDVDDDCPVGSHFIKKNINSFRQLGEGKNPRRHEFRDFYVSNGSDVDDRSCASSDLFELENIGRACLYEEELPVYGTTSVEINQAIAINRQLF